LPIFVFQGLLLLIFEKISFFKEFKKEETTFKLLPFQESFGLITMQKFTFEYKIQWNQVPWILRTSTAVGVWNLVDSFSSSFFSEMASTSPWPTSFQLKQLFQNNFSTLSNLSTLPSEPLEFDFSEFSSSLQDISVGIHFFTPLEILEFSPSTLQGFLQTTNHLWNTYTSSSGSLIIATADIAFVWKYWKWIFSSSCLLLELKNFILPVLPWWHSWEAAGTYFVFI
jgi:hypothetical protein